MKNQKLNLDAFKMMANNVQSIEVMSQIEGGLLDSCHPKGGLVIGSVISNPIVNVATPLANVVVTPIRK